MASGPVKKASSSKPLDMPLPSAMRRTCPNVSFASSSRARLRCILGSKLACNALAGRGGAVAISYASRYGAARAMARSKRTALK